MVIASKAELLPGRVFVVEDGLAHLRTVEVDHRTPFEAEIKSGLEEGAEVIIHPSNQIGEGARVAISQTDL